MVGLLSRLRDVGAMIWYFCMPYGVITSGLGAPSRCRFRKHSGKLFDTSCTGCDAWICNHTLRITRYRTTSLRLGLAETISTILRYLTFMPLSIPFIMPPPSCADGGSVDLRLDRIAYRARLPSLRGTFGDLHRLSCYHSAVQTLLRYWSHAEHFCNLSRPVAICSTGPGCYLDPAGWPDYFRDLKERGE